jgi:hypothetical protein
MFSFIPSFVLDSVMSLAPVRRIQKQVLQDLGIPKDMFTFVNYPTRFDTREVDKALKGSGIAVPHLDDYAWVLWDYWERPPRPGPLHRPVALGQGARQGRRRHRRHLGHRGKRPRTSSRRRARTWSSSRATRRRPGPSWSA